MPATAKHIETNVGRINEADDTELQALWTQAKTEVDATTPPPTTAVPAWKRFVELADKAKVADRIPGTVGRDYARKYGKVKVRARGQRTEVPLSTAMGRAVRAYRKPSDAVGVVPDMPSHMPDTITYTNQKSAEKAVDAMIKRSLADIVRPAKDSAGLRSALKGLRKRVESKGK